MEKGFNMKANCKMITKCKKHNIPLVWDNDHRTHYCPECSEELGTWAKHGEISHKYYVKNNRWNYDLLKGLAEVMKPNKPKEYHSLENVKRGNNCPARIIQRDVKMLLKNLSPETFIGEKIE
jgi:hypothetical protein